MTARGPLTVAVVPAAHPYVRRIMELETSRGLRTVSARPGVVDGESPAEVDTSVERDPAAVAFGDIDSDRDDLDGVDLVHVHFGYDYLRPSTAVDVVAHLREVDTPLVVTVHDIVYPSDADDRPHRADTGTLVEGAAAVTTLTEPAAQEIWVRWGVEAAVVPHSRLLSEEEVAEAFRVARAARVPVTGVVVGVLLERMGENIEGLEVLDALAPVAAARPGSHLRLFVEADAWREAFGEEPREGEGLPPSIAEHGDWESVTVVRYAALDWTSVHRQVAALDAFVLPMRFGTHSSWLELCRDLGVPPVFPAVGFLREQWFGHSAPDVAAGVAYDRREPATLAPAVRDAVDSDAPVPPRSVAGSTEAVVTAYEALYRRTAGQR